MKITKLKALFCIFLLLISCHIVSGEKENTLNVLVEGAIPSKGQVILSIFNAPDNFLKKPIQTQTRQVDNLGVTQFSITDLPVGDYSVSAVYDEDLNGKLNTGFMGIPSELVGFSNNVKSFFGPPSYSDTVFGFHSSMEIVIRLIDATE